MLTRAYFLRTTELRIEERAIHSLFVIIAVTDFTQPMFRFRNTVRQQSGPGSTAPIAEEIPPSRRGPILHHGRYH